MKKLLLAIILALSFQCVGYAAEYNWMYIGSAEIGDQKTDVYIAANSVEKYESEASIIFNLSNDLYAVWSRYVREDESSSLQRYAFDIKNKKINTIAIVTYDKEGRLINNWYNPSEDWLPVIPQSVGEAVFEATISVIDAKT